MLHIRIFSSINHRKRVLGILGIIRNLLGKMPKKLNQRSEEILKKAKEFLDKHCQNNYHDLKIDNNLFVLTGCVLGVCFEYRNNRNKVYFKDLSDSVNISIKCVNFKFDSVCKELVKHIQNHLNEWISEDPQSGLLRLFNLEFALCQSNNSTFLVHLCRCYELIQHLFQ